MWEKMVDAIERKKVTIVRQLLNQNPHLVHEKNFQDETLMHFAAKVGSPEVVADLLVRGAKPDLPDEFGWTPLHEACAQGHEEIITLFLKQSFNLDGTSKNRETALHLATRHGHAKVVAKLLKAGANHEFRNQWGNTPLQVAALAGRVDIMQSLLDAGADLRARNLSGETSLHCTAKEGRVEAAEWCLAHGANPEDQDKNDRNFIETAMHEGRMSFVGYFANLDLPIPTAANPNPLTTTGRNRQEASATKAMAADALTLRGKLVNAFLFGTGKKLGRRWVLPMIEMTLWFFGFPFFLFMVWAGFSQHAIPYLMVFDLSNYPQISELVHTAVSTIIVFLASHYLIASPKDASTYEQFFLNLRPSVFYRVLHFALLSALFYQKMTFDRLFVGQLTLFWFWFLLLYGLAFGMWWNRSPLSKSDSAKEAPRDKRPQGLTQQLKALEMPMGVPVGTPGTAPAGVSAIGPVPTPAGGEAPIGMVPPSEPALAPPADNPAGTVEAAEAKPHPNGKEQPGAKASDLPR